ncbi:type VI secretion system baseplate subunit TssG [Chryseobacterium sp. PTM-20240506]|uniref:type VI secretion system baseplate subunit TssG n=1 Tax=unclassified Chryseobacterium TaxID=2593645 RepID=UPI001E577ABE|nr:MULTISPECIES: type VI secretion system baseplate subunit TssG [unclassified Chryseobacterium]MDC8104114.1 type VI secretion system baseplate subunit TssG [Chryseobacterium sp. B21-037]MDQ1803723.1 type VI secretion system baseplate subunit TssG [Chryseobacterium sp. CKR4-1]WBV57652.1 type VI secretion system baseplate subunit TssG [Chryseobacterium daecheongense]
MHYNKLQTDFKAESVAVNLLKYHRSVSNIFIDRIGINDRAYLKDIKSISSNYLGFDEEVFTIETYREGIYDYLPEGLFHPPSLSTSRKNVESVVKEIRKQKRIEEDARKFFRPFELEIFFTEISALSKEFDFDVSSDTDTLLETISELWPIVRHLDTKNAYIFMHILPFFHNIRGDKRWFERCLTAFLQVPVEVTFTPNVIEDIEENDDSMLLGNSRLGVTYIPSGRHMDGQRNWVVNIGPIPYEKMKMYIPGNPFRKVLQALYDYFLPVTVDVVENFITEKQEYSFKLEDDERNANRLGYSTFL